MWGVSLRPQHGGRMSRYPEGGSPPDGIFMMQRPHVSAAIVSLRGWITTATAMVCLCAILQLLVFSFARFTDVRFTTLTASERAAAVVYGANTPSITPVLTGQPTDVNRVPSVTDRNLATVTGFASSAGLAASVALVLLTMLGVSVGGGGAVPGVHQMVKACSWSMVIAAVSVPWGTAVWGEAGHAGGLLPGVFCSYHSIVLGAEGPGGFQMIAFFVVLPTITMVMAVFVGIWFHSAVERGMIVTAMSQLDAAVEREVAAIRAAGVGAASTARTVGALNQAIGDVPQPLRKAAGAESMSDFGVARSILRSTGGTGRNDHPMRPI